MKQKSEPPFIDAVMTPVAFIRRCVVFDIDQAYQAFAPNKHCVNPDMALCVDGGRCKWVTNCSDAFRFFEDGI